MLGVVDAVCADDQLTREERALVIQLAGLLDLRDVEVEALLARAEELVSPVVSDLELRSGDPVVLTGMSEARKRENRQRAGRVGGVKVSGVNAQPDQPVRYRLGGDNSALRQALWQVDGSRCYACRERKKFVDIEIDHLFPLSQPEVDLNPWRELCGLQPIGSVHDIANLAPICGPCNNDKSNNQHDLPAIQMRARRSDRQAVDVRKAFEELSNPDTTLAELGKAITYEATSPAELDSFVDLTRSLAARASSVSGNVIQGDYEVSGIIENERGESRVIWSFLVDGDMHFINRILGAKGGPSLAEAADFIVDMLDESVAEALLAAFYAEVGSFSLPLTYERIDDIPERHVTLPIEVRIERVAADIAGMDEELVFTAFGRTIAGGTGSGTYTAGNDGDHFIWAVEAEVELEFQVEVAIVFATGSLEPLDARVAVVAVFAAMMDVH